MTDYRIKSHPILIDESEATIPFYWQDKLFYAKQNEMISSALIAQGIQVFRHHIKDHSPQGIFCANGQCSQCMVIADGLPVKACMTAVKEGMKVQPADGLPTLPESFAPLPKSDTFPRYQECEVLIIGAGPAGLSAAVELGKLGVDVLLIDDKNHLGGKLVLQTHRFFGSTNAVYAGTRGIEIAKILAKQVEELPNIEVWTNSTAVGVFEDKVVAVYRDQKENVHIKPKILLVATGARERSLSFSGNTLPGVYGAGAFQTLVNRDLVKPCENLFIIGGGNVGLIAGYHAIQAGIHVAGLVEAAPQCGGYKVHKDKLVRSGVPIYTSHTVLEARGKDKVESVVIAQVDKQFQPIPGTEKIYDCDTLLIAVGLDPVDEFLKAAKDVGMDVYAAGDANEIAEASAAIFSGKIVGNEIAKQLGKDLPEIPVSWLVTEKILKSKPGMVVPEHHIDKLDGVFPVFHCTQEIPCNPCSSVCPKDLIFVDETDIRHLPHFDEERVDECIACGRCVAVCPGLAISLIDFRKREQTAMVSLPVEQNYPDIVVGNEIEATNTDGLALGKFKIEKIKTVAGYKDGTRLLSIEVPTNIAKHVAGFTVIRPSQVKEFEPDSDIPGNLDDDAYICRCERVTVGEIKKLIKLGVRDINQIKAVTHASMGSCGGKTCLNLIKRMFTAEGVPLSEVTDPPVRPVYVEVPVKDFIEKSSESAGKN
jgi:NADPH-dependent 2,4-dienoyl-CoA reductase/sulfur reductase-like enzyme/formate hydrogenlyase subunit 6/NADH:ubiquinone oxidoreductase subunit I/bacterioferritin-associated ferredoxin